MALTSGARFQSIFSRSYIVLRFRIEPLVNLHAVIRLARTRGREGAAESIFFFFFFPGTKVFLVPAMHGKIAEELLVIGRLLCTNRFSYKRLYHIYSSCILKLEFSIIKKPSTSFNNVELQIICRSPRVNIYIKKNQLHNKFEEK